MEIHYLPVPKEVGFVDLADGLQVPERLRAEITKIGIPAVIEMEVAVRDGAVVCEAITFRSLEGGPSLTREMLRDVPVSRLASALMTNSSLIWDFSHPAWDDVDTSKAVVVGMASAPEAVKDWVDEQTRPRRRRRITDEFLGSVAGVYRKNLDGGAPTRAVADVFKVNHSTAARYVAQARERGLLGRTTAGLAGEGERTVTHDNEEQP